MLLALLTALTSSACHAATDSPRPNIILILADDLGWSDLGAYGGEIATPNIDRLAQSGIRYTQFYNSAKCEPTRTSLMSGQYWQDSGLGVKHGITIGEALRSAGYTTLAVGKWHLDGNPVNRGFDHFFGHLAGASDYFIGDPSHRLDRAPYHPPTDGSFYTTDANADFAIQFLRAARQENPQRPFFLYLAFNAPHAPIQAWPEDIAKYRGSYRQGWDVLREQRYRRMMELGVISQNRSLSARPDTIPPWDSLSAAEQDQEDLRMSIYAAMVDRMDQAIGRVLAEVRALGQESNTLVMFLSDNGANPYDERRIGTLPDRTARWSYGMGWANLSNTPFMHYKMNMANGGAATPFIVSWPARLTSPGRISDEQGHITDIMATLIDIGGWTWPAEYRGKPLAALPGKSLRPSLTEEGSSALRDPLFFQLLDSRAIVHRDWKLVSDWNHDWQLFNIRTDRTETQDLAAELPDVYAELLATWNRWWSDKNPALLRTKREEPSYRRIFDGSAQASATVVRDP